jgi:hypothetical protein
MNNNIQLNSSQINQMIPKKYRKENLPQKTCVICGRPFYWRKKWSKVWNEIKYCSDKCRVKSKLIKKYEKNNLLV